MFLIEQTQVIINIAPCNGLLGELFVPKRFCPGLDQSSIVTCICVQMSCIQVIENMKILSTVSFCSLLITLSVWDFFSSGNGCPQDSQLCCDLWWDGTTKKRHWGLILTSYTVISRIQFVFLNPSSNATSNEVWFSRNTIWLRKRIK